MKQRCAKQFEDVAADAATMSAGLFMTSPSMDDARASTLEGFAAHAELSPAPPRPRRPPWARAPMTVVSI
jgi:hypothetical protein